MTWTQARPLRTAPGHALATEIADAPQHAGGLVAGALERLARWEEPDPGGAFSRQETEQLLEDYLRGLAAAAIVADTVSGVRAFTGAEDFSVGGREVALLDAPAVTLGLVSRAASAAFTGKWAVLHLRGCAGEGVLDEHHAQAHAVRTALSAAAQRLLGQA